MDSAKEQDTTRETAPNETHLPAKTIKFYTVWSWGGHLIFSSPSYDEANAVYHHHCHKFGSPGPGFYHLLTHEAVFPERYVPSPI